MGNPDSMNPDSLVITSSRNFLLSLKDDFNSLLSLK